MTTPDLGVSLATGNPVSEDLIAGIEGIVDAAVKGGADLIQIGDRHANPSPFGQNVPLLAHLLDRMGSTPKAAVLYLAPLWHPLLLVELTGTLAWLANRSGRELITVLALGRRDHTLDAFGLTPETQLARLEESLELFRRNNASEPGAGPVPFSRPMPLWMASEAPSALRRTARWADGWIANASYTEEQLAAQIQVLRDHRRHDQTPLHLALRRDIVCLHDHDRAVAMREDILAHGYRGGFPPESIVAGDPERCAEALRPLVDMGAGTILVRPAVADPSIAEESVTTFMSEVRAWL